MKKRRSGMPDYWSREHVLCEGECAPPHAGVHLPFINRDSIAAYEWLDVFNKDDDMGKACVHISMYRPMGC